MSREKGHFAAIAENIAGPDIQDFREYHVCFETFQQWRNHPTPSLHTLASHRRALYEWRTYHLMENDIEEMKLAMAYRKAVSEAIVYAAEVERLKDPATRDLPLSSRSSSRYQATTIAREPWSATIDSRSRAPQSTIAHQTVIPQMDLPIQSRIASGKSSGLRRPLEPVHQRSSFFNP
jgi:hypothetical protein